MDLSIYTIIFKVFYVHYDIAFPEKSVQINILQQEPQWTTKDLQTFFKNKHMIYSYEGVL